MTHIPKRVGGLEICHVLADSVALYKTFGGGGGVTKLAIFCGYHKWITLYYKLNNGKPEISHSFPPSVTIFEQEKQVAEYTHEHQLGWLDFFVIPKYVRCLAWIITPLPYFSSIQIV